jgi:hypothetical protein
VAILHRDESSDWLKILVLAASLGGFVGALELWFFEFSLNRLLAAVAAGATFGVVFVTTMRVAPVATPTRGHGVLYAVPSGLASGTAWWLVAAPETSLWVALATGVVLGCVMVFGEW